MTTEEVKKILSDHKRWLVDGNGKRADLSNADLRGADLSRAYLSGADLRAADLRAADLSRCTGFMLLPVQDARGYSWPHAVQQKDGTWKIRAGCRFFTIEEAREHWGAGYKGDREIGDLYCYAVDWLESKRATTEPESL